MLATKTLIDVNNINLKYKGKNILDNVSFELKHNNFITLIGPNGAGKSSLIKVMLGIIKPDSGTIKHASGIRIGYTPQTFNQNLFIPISVMGFLKLNKTVSKDFIHKIIDLAGIEGLLERQLKNLSGGELQHVLLSRALLTEPNVLILDEPAQNLDINGQMQLYELIHSIHKKQNCAIFMVSHDLHRVMRDSTQVLCLYHHICCIGKPESILKNSQFNDLFAEQMEALTTTYKHQHNHKHDD